MINIIPINDLEDHSHNFRCKCNPKVEVVNVTETLVIHNSFDNRELIERIIEPYKNGIKLNFDKGWIFIF